MRILMLGNSFIFTNDLPRMLADRTGAEVVHHTRGGAELAEQLDPDSLLGAQTQAALQNETWDYVVLQEKSNGPIAAPESFFRSIRLLCQKVRQNGAVPLLYATWAYQKGGKRLAEEGLEYDEMARRLFEAYHQAALENHALIADVGQQFYVLSRQENLYADDGFHPNERGSQIAADTIAAVIRQHEEERRPSRASEGVLG